MKQNIISLIKELKKMYLAFIIPVFVITLISFFIYCALTMYILIHKLNGSKQVLWLL